MNTQASGNNPKKVSVTKAKQVARSRSSKTTGNERQMVLTHTADGLLVKAEVVGGKAVKVKKFVI